MYIKLLDPSEKEERNKCRSISNPSLRKPQQVQLIAEVQPWITSAWMNQSTVYKHITLRKQRYSDAVSIIFLSFPNYLPTY